MNKKGRGIKDFIKNNKKALGIGAATIALLSLYNHKQRNPDYIPDYKFYGSGKLKCECGLTPKSIMKKIGGRKVALLLHKHPKILIGKGWLGDLAKYLTKKTLNILSEEGIDMAINLAVFIVGEPFREIITQLLKIYGVKALKFIKKYAKKGINYIAEKLQENKDKKEKKGSGGICHKCEYHLENLISKNKIKPHHIAKMGAGFLDELGDAFIWAGKNVISPVISGVTSTILPGSAGRLISGAITAPIDNLDTIAHTLSPSYTYTDPTKDTRDAIYFRRKYKGAGKPKKHSYSKIIKLLKKSTKLIPVSLLEDLYSEVYDPETYSILPKRVLSDRTESIWGGSNILPSEDEIRIQPYPYPVENDMGIDNMDIYEKPIKDQYWGKPTTIRGGNKKQNEEEKIKHNKKYYLMMNILNYN